MRPAARKYRYVEAPRDFVSDSPFTLTHPSRSCWKGSNLAVAENDRIAETNAIFGQNRLKLGLFGINCDHACAMTLVDEAFRLTWSSTREIAVTADRAGFEALVPVARWKGIGDHDFNGRNFETYTWAAGLAEATENITLVTTAHVQATHPVVAAKAVSTIDHISGGRSCLNVVTGWFQPEFKMFGSELLDHDARYAYATEWTQLVKRLWSEEAEFNHLGKYFNVEGGYSMPKPVRSSLPPIMNAGVSAAGRTFIAEQADVGYVVLTDHADLETGRRTLAGIRERAAQQGREVCLWTTAYVVQRDTMKESKNYFERYVNEHGDESAGVATAHFLGVTAEAMSPNNYESFKTHLKAGYGGYPLIGTAEDVASGLQLLSELGFDGVALTYVDFIDGLHRFNADVMPALERAGLREPYVRRARWGSEQSDRG